METMKFDEDNDEKSDNSGSENSSINNSPAPEAPGEEGASVASAASAVNDKVMAAPKAPLGNGNIKGGGGGGKNKLIIAGVILAVLILSVVAWQYWRYTQTPYYKQMQAVKTLEKMAEESDKWGGKTPEETVALFSDAVKKGDFELASRYGNREDVLPILEKMEKDEKIKDLIKWLEAGKINVFVGGYDADLKITENGQDFWILSMHKSGSGTWKIDEF